MGRHIKYERAWSVLNITSLGFSDIGFSPWASRTWTEMKGEKHVKGQGSSKSKHVFLLDSATCLSNKHISCSIKHVIVVQVIMTVIAIRSYVFCICPSALGRPHFPLSHQPQGQVRKGCQVSTSTHCSLLRDEGEAGSCSGRMS